MNSWIGAARNIITNTASMIAATMIDTWSASPTAVSTESSEKTMSTRPIWIATASRLVRSCTSPCPCSAPSSAPWISLTLLMRRNTPPANRIRSRPEISSPSTVNQGAVSPISQVSENRSPIRVTIAKASPRIRPRGWRSFGNFDTRIERKMMLSIPRTISRNVSVRNDTHAAGSDRSSNKGLPHAPLRAFRRRRRASPAP